MHFISRIFVRSVRNVNITMSACSSAHGTTATERYTRTGIILLPDGVFVSCKRV